MKFKDFEIIPTCFLDGHIDPKQFDLVKWHKTDKPVNEEVTHWLPLPQPLKGE